MFQLKGFHFDYISKRHWFVAFSVVTVLISLIAIFTKGLNWGTDFKGGLNLQYQFSAPISDGDVRHMIEPLGVGGFSVQKIGKTEENRFVIKLEKSESEQELSQKVTEGLQKAYTQGTVTLVENRNVGAKAGEDLRKKAQLALIISWILMLIYIGFRFDFFFAPGAIIALVHDVVMALGGFAITGREVSLTVIAALLTIVGYSINDTIVVYDRIREDLKKYEKKSLREVVNLSLNEMFPRTIITSFTVFIVVSLMYFFGEGEFQNFGFAMIIGVVTGVYSTLSIACPLYIWLKENQDKAKGVALKKA